MWQKCIIKPVLLLECTYLGFGKKSFWVSFSLTPSEFYWLHIRQAPVRRFSLSSLCNNENRVVIDDFTIFFVCRSHFSYSNYLLFR